MFSFTQTCWTGWRYLSIFQWVMHYVSKLFLFHLSRCNQSQIKLWFWMYVCFMRLFVLCYRFSTFLNHCQFLTNNLCLWATMYIFWCSLFSLILLFSWRHLSSCVFHKTRFDKDWVLIQRNTKMAYICRCAGAWLVFYFVTVHYSWNFHVVFRQFNFKLITEILLTLDKQNLSLSTLNSQGRYLKSIKK